MRQELRARRGRGKHRYAAAFAFVRLVHVAPYDAAHVRMGVDDAPEIVGIGEAYAIEPATAHGDRVVMQADHGVRLRAREIRVQPGEFRRREAAADVPGVVAVQHDELPVADGMGAAVSKWGLAESAAHGLGLVVVAGNTQDGRAQAAEYALEAQIARRIVVDQITRDQDGGVLGRVRRKSVIEHGAQTRIGFYPRVNYRWHCHTDGGL